MAEIHVLGQMNLGTYTNGRTKQTDNRQSRSQGEIKDLEPAELPELEDGFNDNVIGITFHGSAKVRQE